VFGERTGFAHSSDPSLAALKRAGETAAAARKGRDAVMAPRRRAPTSCSMMMWT
jgi:TldD protein